MLLQVQYKFTKLPSTSEVTGLHQSNVRHITELHYWPLLIVPGDGRGELVYYIVCICFYMLHVLTLKMEWT